YNKIYAQMQEVLSGLGAENNYVGTLEAEPSLEDVMAANEGKAYQRVVQRPMMVVAGDHATNDMAGDEEDSWKTILTEAGYEVVCVLEGLGQVPEIQQIYVEHAQAAVAQIAE
ncbi:MAG: sirohydrochlorin cobaltochelatase, partial [Clostridia bacterium]|nr:sirohydrochlorin cobaltochelatase [Clostridia bacterium]